MVSNGKLGTAVIGLGVGEQHARTYHKLESCELRYLYDLDGEKAARLAKALGSLAAASYEQILADPKINIISIASFDDDHFIQAMAALQAGKHTFVEKPLARTQEELLALKQAWQKHDGNIKLSSNLVLRAAPLYRWLKKSIAAGEFGEIYAIDGDYLYGRLSKITEGWRKDITDYSVMEGGGIHLIDLVLWLTGQLPGSVTSVGNRICTNHSAFRYNDYAAATLVFPSGMVGRVTANFGCVHRHQHVLRVFGTRKTFIYDDAGARLHSSRDPEARAEKIELSPLPAAKGDLIPAFISAILQDEDLSEHTRQMFDDISICIACDEAMRRNTIIEVEYV